MGSRQVVCASATARAVDAAEHCDPADIEYASRVDRFDFAMEVTLDDVGRRLEAR